MIGGGRAIFTAALMIAVTSSPSGDGSQAFAQDGTAWTPWATNDDDGSRRGPLYVPVGSQIYAIQAKEQSGYGIVNLRIQISTPQGLEWSPWISCNPDGTPTAVLLPSQNTYFTGIEVLYQDTRYGIVNFHMKQSDGNYTSWISTNMAGTKYRAECSAGRMDGVEAMERGGSGLVDARVHCQ